MENYKAVFAIGLAGAVKRKLSADDRKALESAEAVNFVFNDCILTTVNIPDEAKVEGATAEGYEFLLCRPVVLRTEMDEKKEDVNRELLETITMFDDDMVEYLNNGGTALLLYNNGTVGVKANYNDKTIKYEVFNGARIYVPIDTPAEMHEVFDRYLEEKCSEYIRVDLIPDAHDDESSNN